MPSRFKAKVHDPNQLRSGNTVDETKSLIFETTV
jgi:hypothetical protein